MARRAERIDIALAWGADRSATKESGIHPDYRPVILHELYAGTDDTSLVRTTVFWPAGCAVKGLLWNIISLFNPRALHRHGPGARTVSAPISRGHRESSILLGMRCIPAPSTSRSAHILIAAAVLRAMAGAGRLSGNNIRNTRPLRHLTRSTCARSTHSAGCLLCWPNIWLVQSYWR